MDPAEGRVREQLDRVLESSQFRDSLRLQKFLRFVVEATLAGDQERIKETTVGFEVFGRSGTADDSIVRSAARRLRARLEEYYQLSGENDPVRIVIPRGSYVPVFECRNPPPAPPVFLDPEPPLEQQQLPPVAAPLSSNFLPSNLRSTQSVLATVALLLAVCAAALLLFTHLKPERRANKEAEQLYLQGRYYWSKRTPESLNRAVDFFTQAIVKDPRSAEGYVGLADSYNLLSEYSSMPYRDAFARSIAAAQTAVALNGRSPEAHCSLAFASFYGGWNAAAAEHEFRTALRLNPDYVTAHHWFATFLMSVGREEEALEEIEQAQALQPAAPSILADEGLILTHSSGSSAKGQAMLEDLELSDPQFLSPHSYLAQIYFDEKRFGDYLAELKQVSASTGDLVMMRAVAEASTRLATGGPEEMLRGMLHVQEAMLGERARYFPVAQTCAMIGDREKALHYLDLAVQHHETPLVALGIDRAFSRLWNDSAFREVVRRVGVEP